LPERVFIFSWGSDRVSGIRNKNVKFEAMFFIRATLSMKFIFPFILLLSADVSLQAQTTNDLLNLLIQNHTITREQADSLRAEAAIAEQGCREKGYLDGNFN